MDTVASIHPDLDRHLARAIRDGIRIVKLDPERSDVAVVQSGENRYFASVRGCSCQAGRAGTPCKHSTLVAVATGQTDAFLARIERRQRPAEAREAVSA